MTLQTKRYNGNCTVRNLVVKPYESLSNIFGKHYDVFPDKITKKGKILEKAHNLEETLLGSNQLKNKECTKIVCPSTYGLSYMITHGDGIYTSSINWYGMGETEPQSIGRIEKNNGSKELKETPWYEKNIHEFERKAVEEFFKNFTYKDFIKMKELEKEIVEGKNLKEYFSLKEKMENHFKVWKNKKYKGSA